MAKNIVDIINELIGETKPTPYCDIFLESIDNRRKKRLWEGSGDIYWFIKASQILKGLDKKKLQEIGGQELLDELQMVLNEIDMCMCE
jgi:hypothetical protein